jgi:DNA mismatch endonuclease (patch repair protein)
MPATRSDFWATKIAENRDRDVRNMAALRAAGWRVLTIWECCFKGPARQAQSQVISNCISFVKGNAQVAELYGAGTLRVRSYAVQSTT